MTTDPNDADFAYAEWDRQVSPPGETPNAWTQKEIVVDDFFRGIVVDPDDGQPVRTGDINPRSLSTPTRARSTSCGRTDDSVRAAAWRSPSRSTAG